MTDSSQPTEHTSAPFGPSPLPTEVEGVSACAWRSGAAEIIVFQGAAQLATAAGQLTLEAGVWLLARWASLSLEDTPDGELVCVLPENPLSVPPAPECLAVELPRRSDHDG